MDPTAETAGCVLLDPSNPSTANTGRLFAVTLGLETEIVEALPRTMKMLGLKGSTESSGST